MRAAIYARKSTEQIGVADAAKSVSRQVDGARAFIEKRAWTLDEAHVYADDGVSGALFESRAAFQRMMRDALAGAFDAVVFYDLDRLGRDSHKTMVALNTLADLGVSMWDYSTGLAVDLETFEGGTMTFLKTRFAQQYREQVRKHTRAAMWRKAEQGHVAGGKVFGYENKRIAKNVVVRVILRIEADVVVRIFEMFADGVGARSIAKALNAAGAPSPRAQADRPNGWSASTVKDVLKRALYRGEIVYGRSAKAYGRELGRRSTREKGQIRRPEETWLRREAPDLRIIDADLAARVAARLNSTRARYFASVAKGGRVPERAHGKFLLSGGMLVCPVCGAHFEARMAPWMGIRGGVYICSTRRRKPGVCRNTLALPIADTDNAVLSEIEGEVLGTRVIGELLALVDTGVADETDHLTNERDRLRTEVERLVASIAAGVPPDSVAPLIRKNEAEIAKLEVRLRTPRPEAPNLDRLRAALEQRTASWRADLRAEPRVARLVVRRLLSPLVLWDETAPEWNVTEEQVEWMKADPEFAVRWEAATKPTALLDGLVDANLLMASPTGFEPVFWP